MPQFNRLMRRHGLIVCRERFDTGSRAAFGDEAQDGAFLLGAPQTAVAARVVVRLGDAERIPLRLYLVLKLPEIDFAIRRHLSGLPVEPHIWLYEPPISPEHADPQA